MRGECWHEELYIHDGRGIYGSTDSIADIRETF